MVGMPRNQKKYGIAIDINTEMPYAISVRFCLIVIFGISKSSNHNNKSVLDSSYVDTFVPGSSQRSVFS